MEIAEDGTVVGLRECAGEGEIDAMAGVEFYSGTIVAAEGELEAGRRVRLEIVGGAGGNIGI